MIYGDKYKSCSHLRKGFLFLYLYHFKRGHKFLDRTYLFLR